MTKILQACAIGDALGAGYEFAPQDEVRRFHLDDGFRQHRLHTDIKPGMFTDDTMMSVMAARALIEDLRANEGTARRETFERAMVAHHKAHPTNGYSKHMREALDASPDTIALRNFFDSTFRSDSNGAAMRAMIYGVLPTVQEAMQSAFVAGSATHSGLGLTAAQAVAAASHYFVHGRGGQYGLSAYLTKHVGPIWTIRFTDRVAKSNGPLSVITVCAALTILRDANCYSEVIERAIRLGGDTDTVAAIAMGLAVSNEEIEDDLPASYWTDAIQPVAGLTFADLVALDAEVTALDP